ncbi:MAG TPA: hypothetical protein VIJ92_00705 [Ginsengibacter sp.]
MEENKFEKQVQQKMDELQIQPSESIWEKIEVQIGKKKKRKWGVLILFLCIGVLLSGTYCLWNAGRQEVSKNTNSEKSILKKNSNSSSVKENKIVQQQINPVPESENKKNNDVAKDEEKGKEKQNRSFNTSRPGHPFNSVEKSTISFSGRKKIKEDIHGKTETETFPAEALQSQVANENIIRDSLNANEKKINIDSVSKPVVLDKITKQQDTSKQKTMAETVRHSVKNRWKFGVLFIGGISGVGTDFLALDNSPAYSSPGSLNLSGPPQQSRFSSPVMKAAFSFVTGLSAEKNISKKIKFVSGINFRSSSASFKLYDSAGAYYARGAANKYINHFNFIEVPLSLKIQIGKVKNLPMLWQGGISISELISSNALQLNASTGYYYKDNSLFNKTQIGFNTAFLLTLFSTQKNSVLIGPYLYYDASKIANEGLYYKRHFVFTGLHTAIILGK